jgi:hypothetical protein
MVERQVTSEIKERVWDCDVCDEKGLSPGCSDIHKRAHRCYCCRRDLCFKCKIYDDRDFSDYPPAFCRVCWDTGTAYRQYIKDAEEEHDKAMERLENTWYEKARQKVREK